MMASSLLFATSSVVVLYNFVGLRGGVDNVLVGVVEAVGCCCVVVVVCTELLLLDNPIVC